MEPEKWVYEKRARKKGFRKIAGIDEAGRGPLAGPVVAACCLLNEKLVLPEIDDSKKLSEKKREAIFEILTNGENAFYGVGIISPEVIDTVNIFQATILAMHEAVSKMPKIPDYLLVDGLALPPPKTLDGQVPWESIPREKIIKGDTLSYSIGAASIIAKVVRDRIMKEIAAEYPEFGFERHKGYATKDHLNVLKKMGPCKYHRKSFSPIR